MLSRIIKYDKGSIQTELDILETNILLNAYGFSESGMLENIAQSGAAMVGLESRKRGEAVPLGFIGGINKVKVYGFANSGATLSTQVDIIQEVMNITLIKGKCFWKGELLLECEMKIVINP